VALPALEATLSPIPVIGVVEPGAEAAVSAAPHGPIAVIATEGTVRGGAYLRAIQQRAPGISVVQRACPLFVALAEEGLVDGEIAEAIARRYLDSLLADAPAALVLGCTHFPVLAKTIARVAGSNVALVDSAATTAEAVARLLNERGLARNAASSQPHQFIATDAPERFARVGAIFLGRPIAESDVELVDLQT
jgi:glutamate racemase